MFYIALWVAKCADWFIKTFHLGAGSTWPGEIALSIDSHFVQHSIDNNVHIQTIIIAGTNGKTTTSRLIVHGLHTMGRVCVTNPEGANLLNGVASSLVKNSTPGGHIDADCGVFEADENALIPILGQLSSPTVVVLLNLFRDQLDRYGEVHVVAKKWRSVLEKLPNTTSYVINGDDPLLGHIGLKRKNTIYFGAPDEEKKNIKMGHDVDSVFCPECGNKLSYSGIVFSHLGSFRCSSCGYGTPTEVQLPATELLYFKGAYNRYNARAATQTLAVLTGLNEDVCFPFIRDCKPAFGRQEHLSYKGKEWIVLLSKNPAGFNQSINTLEDILGGKKSSVLIVLNDRIPDGTDVSWIWDVEFKNVSKYAQTVYLSGDRVYDMAIRMETACEVENLVPEEHLERVVETIAHEHTTTCPIVVLATYTGMLEVRKILRGKALL